jgi:LacI family transcriptional regulator
MPVRHHLLSQNPINRKTFAAMKKLKKVSMKDIADELNLSITTVSFVVNGKSESISAATIEKVKRHIKLRGFNPNNAARVLRTGKSKTIGLIIEDIGNFFFAQMAKVIEREAYKNGFKVFLSSTDADDEKATEILNKMKHSSVDGLIVISTPGLKNEIAQLQKEHIPFVLLDRTIPDLETNSVILDNYKGAQDLTCHLLENGYHKIGYISMRDGMSQLQNRKNGFMDAIKLTKNPLASCKLLELSFYDSNEMILQKIKDFLMHHKELDSLFFASNFLGILGIEAIQQCGFKIPDDFAVVSFDDNDLFRLMSPSITVVSQPVEELAKKSIELLLKCMEKGGQMNQLESVLIQPELIVRNSTKKRKKK